MKARKQSKPRPKKFTVDEVFTYGEDTRAETIIGIRCVAFLLDSISDMGNRNIDGLVAEGLNYALQHYADRVEKLRLC